MVKCMLDRTYFDKKPCGKEIGAIQNRLKATDITIKELSKELIRGSSFRPSFLVGLKETDWTSQQLFSLDFDDDTTIQEELNKCRELNILPTFGYTSFSHTEEHHKFRLVFCMDQVIDNYNIAKQIQEILMCLFNKCDKQCSNLSRLYFGGRSLIYEGYNNRIDYKSILNKHGGLTVHSNRYIYNTNYCVRKNPLKPIDNINYNIQAIKELNVDYIKSVVNVDIKGFERKGGKEEECIYNTLLPFPLKPKYIANTRIEVYNIINNIDLSNFLGIDNPSNFKCIFHNDNNPSAGIFKGYDGSDIYKCQSSTCGFVGGIIKCVEKLARCDKPTAINFIKQVYNIELVQSKWQKEQIELLEINKEYLISGKMDTEYPELWKYVKPRLSKLICFIDLAIKNCYDKELSNDNKPVFYSSTRQLQVIFDTRSMKTVNNTINLFALLDLIKKLPKENIPDNMLKKAKRIAATKGHKKLVNHYQIPSYCINTLEKSEDKARILKENNFTMKGLSREWVIRTFGQDIADLIYPQYRHENSKGTSKKSDSRTNEIVKVIMNKINNKKYVTEKEIVEELRGKYGKAFIQTQIKRSLQEILEGYNLKRIRCNKKIKEKYGVTSNGYPFIIVKN